MSSSGWLPAASGLHTPEFLPGPHISDNQKRETLKRQTQKQKGHTQNLRAASRLHTLEFLSGPHISGDKIKYRITPKTQKHERQ